MGPELTTGVALELLVTVFLALVFVNAVVICVPVTQDGPVELPDWDRPTVELAPVSTWEYPPAGHAPMRFGEASAEAERIWSRIVDWARAEEARQVRR